MDDLSDELQQAFKKLPKDARTVITSHEAFGYMARDFDLNFLSPQGLATEADPSAKEVARLIKKVRKQRVKALFVENTSDDRVLTRIAEETGAKIGGKLYSDSLSMKDGPAPTYLQMMRQNAQTLLDALAPASR